MNGKVHGVVAGERNRVADDCVFTKLHLFGEHPHQIDVWQGKGIHGGADPIMLGDLFAPESTPEGLRRRSSHPDSLRPLTSAPRPLADGRQA